MKSTLYLLALLLAGPCLARSVVPARVVTPNLNIFSAKTLPNGMVKVPVSSYNKKGEFRKNNSEMILTNEAYTSFKNLSLPVFEMIPNGLFRADSEYSRRGTAFSIGENLVLTNQHVLDPKRKNVTSCGDSEVKDNSGSTHRCKKVHFCSIEEDFCLIEMKPLMKTKRDCFLCRGEEYDASLSVGPKHKLKAHYFPEKRGEEILTAIGNTEGFGIHFSQGIGMRFIMDHLIFYAPISVGNSGGALLNSEDLVVGVVKAQTQVLISDDPNRVYNVATPTYVIIRLIREAIQNDPETLEKFNLSVVE